MKPNFALSLSFEGIKLLHRAAGGWREVGEVPVTADDLAGELAVLRKTAASLEPGGVRTKLLIPPSQVKYLTIDTIGLSEAARRKAAEAALHNATPYEVSELAFDLSMDGAKTHIAAVARETLAEAEAFANEHRFHPVSFVAVPGDAPYLGEPFFGTTQIAESLLDTGETVESDGIAVVVVGSIAPEFIPPQMTEAAAEPKSPPVAPQKPVEATPTPTPTPTPKSEAKSHVEDKPDIKPSPTSEETTPAPQTARAEPAAATAPTQPAAPVAAAAPPSPAKPEPEAHEPEMPPKAEQTGQPELRFEPTPAPKPPLQQAPQASATQHVSPPEPAPPVAKPDPVDPARAAMLAAASATGPNTTISEPAPVAQTPLEPQPFKAAPPASEAPTVTQTPIPPAAIAPVTGFASRRTPSTGAAGTRPVGGAQRIAVQTPRPDSSSLTKPAEVAATTASSETPVAAVARTVSGFLSRRKPRAVAASPIPAPKSLVGATGSEAERMTVFGARTAEVGGKPRFLGLIMTVILLIFLAGVAAWAAVFLDEGIAGLMQKDKARATASAPENQIDPEVIRTTDGIDPDQADTSADVQIAALDPVLSAAEAANVEAALDPRPEPQLPVITEAEAAARYAVTGIWPLAPTTPLSEPDTVDAPVYRSGIDPVSGANDALALPAPQEIDSGVQLAAAISPPPFGQRTDMGADGLIVPTEDGVVTPEGFTLFAASPPLKPPATLARFVAQPTLDAPAATSTLAGLRPKNRPLGLNERTERAQLGGVSRGELAAFRPALRPRSVQERAQDADDAETEAAEDATEQEDARAKAAAQSAAAAAAAALLVPVAPVAATPATIVATRLATAESKRPDTRPRNFSRIVSRAQRAAPQEETRVAAVASVAPRTVTPSLPSKASVARSATVKNAINLRKVNLIGIYGKPSSRRALVRLGNGRYQKVRVGDRIDGGRVGSISNSELSYSKSGRNVVLKMP